MKVGVCWVPSSAEHRITAVHSIQNWPGCASWSDVSCKTPSRIAYSHENASLETNQWGFAVSSKMISYSWTKLLLYQGPSCTEIDDPVLNLTDSSDEDFGSVTHQHLVERIYDSSLMSLPEGIPAQQVCIDYLREVYKFTMATLERRITADILAETPLEFWFSVPAIWLDKSRARTKDIAMTAGFGSRGADRLYLIAEPEAAAIATLSGLGQTGLNSFFGIGDNILVCDCGGGTVDLISYTIIGISPQMRFRELTVGSGGRCGSTYIDRQFLKWMARKFGELFTLLGQDKIGPGSRFMKEFESHKKHFGASELDDFEVTLNMPGGETLSTDNYDWSEKVVRFSQADMASFFQPAIQGVKELIKQQLDLVQNSKSARVKKICLVGGFGDSIYLKRVLDSWCQSEYPGVTITQPPEPQAAIMKGAALRGHTGLKPEERICRRHYGFVLGKPFRENLDKEEDKIFEPWHEEYLCNSRMEWTASKVSLFGPVTCGTVLQDVINIVSRGKT